MLCRVTSIWRRVYFTVVSGLVVLGFLGLILSDPGGTRPGNVAILSFLMAWAVVIGVRGWRSATLLASTDQVTVRGLARTISFQWQQIDRFVADTRLTRWVVFPVHVRRRVLGIRLRNGQTRWLAELSCRTASHGPTWVDNSMTKLNELLAAPGRRVG